MLIVENHLPDSDMHKAVDEVPEYFPNADGRLVVTQPQNSSDVVLDLTGLDGKRETDVLMMWDQMGMSPEQEAKVLRERIAELLQRPSQRTGDL
jgi:hypothetical protein